MFNTWVFPDKFKVAKIMPIHTQDDETFFANYRPGSLLSAISKIVENAIFKNLFIFIYFS